MHCTGCIARLPETKKSEITTCNYCGNVYVVVETFEGCISEIEYVGTRRNDDPNHYTLYPVHAEGR